ncbi:TadE/TadG family type IV pilus assembly protein [Methylobacterium nigriterrae]|uniref:TadE/TadG family type IV pilus assembly protein n=1 Tax=Methylobacterium nigriterrae TaxID=3127512 RepID=UPI003013A51A
MLRVLTLAARFRARNGRARPAFLRAREGSTAVEFALLALPFLAILSAILEVAIGSWAQDMLQQAVSDAGRQIYTGRFQKGTAGTSGSANLLDAFRSQLCQENGQPRNTLFACANVRLNIQQVDDFQNVALVAPTAVNPATGASDWNPAFGSAYACGRTSAIVVIQAAVDFPVFFALLNPGAVTLPGGRRVLQAATVFRVEPYDSTGVCS